MLSFECIKNEKSVYFLLTSAYFTLQSFLLHTFHFLFSHRLVSLHRQE